MLARVNPLYTQGMGRVGCLPCINCSKDELREIATRFPEAIEQIRRFESLVSQASKRAQATFFHHSDGYEAGRIDQMVEWAKTSRGGVQYDIFFVQPGEPTGCSSSYGLCEQGGVE